MTTPTNTFAATSRFPNDNINNNTKNNNNTNNNNCESSAATTSSSNRSSSNIVRTMSLRKRPRPVPASLSQIRGESIDDEMKKYHDYPFLQSLLRNECIRKTAFRHDGYCQFDYPAGNSGWISTMLVWRGRALGNIFMPWFVVSVHSVLVILLFRLGGFDQQDIADIVGDWGTFYGLVINVMLSFLLVFRLNRAAARYWSARLMWGKLIAYGRSLTSGILNHGGHNPTIRDEAIQWLAASAASTMAFIRGDKTLPHLCMAGILNDHQLSELEASMHMPIYATDRVRDCLKELFHVTAETTPPSLAHAWSIQLDRLEQLLNDYTLQYGGMERIRGTPLPIVYVAHLRTFLMLHLLLFPYVFGPNQGWATIPLTMITAFAFLGIEGASVEVENPFKKHSVNNLNMDALAMALIENIQQQVQTKADLEIRRRSSHHYGRQQQHEIYSTNGGNNSSSKEMLASVLEQQEMQPFSQLQQPSSLEESFTESSYSFDRHDVDYIGSA